MSGGVAFGLVLLLAFAGWWLGQQKGLGFIATHGTTVGAVHSRPGYHGAFVAILALLPALLVLAAWGLARENLVAREVLASLPPGAIGASELDRAAFLSEVRGLVGGD